MARSKALNCGILATWVTWPIMSRPCWQRARSKGMSARRSQLASWAAIPLAPITWYCSAPRQFSTVQISTSSTSKLVRHFSGKHVEMTSSLHVLSRLAYRGRQSGSMQRVAFIMRIKPGTEEEYRQRHRRVWPELLADLKRAGCQNYSIYLRGTELFAYMEVDNFQRYLKIMAASRASERWEAQMSDILIRETATATGFPPALEEVFHLD